MSKEWYSHIKPVGEFDSKFEKAIHEQLKAAGVKVIHHPKPLGYEGPDGEPRRYFPDFLVKTKDGKWVYIEVKGWMNSEAIQKMLRVQRCNPDQEIRFIFQNGKGHPGKLKCSNLQWAKSCGFPAAEKAVPDEWIAEFRTEEEVQQRKNAAASQGTVSESAQGVRLQP